MSRILSIGAEKHLKVKQDNKPNIQYLLEAGIPMMSSKQAWTQIIHSGSMSKVNSIKMYKCTFDECNISRSSWYFDMVF